MPLIAAEERTVSANDKITVAIIGCGIRVHEAFGPGLFESIYKACFVIELKASGLKVDASRRVPLTYRGRNLDAEFAQILSWKKR